MEALLRAIDPVIAALRPYIQPITHNLPTPVRDLSITLLGESCHKRLLLDIAPTPTCTSLAISKALGILIVTASAIVKIPQLLKLYRSGSAAGVSFWSYVLETTSFLISLAYGYRNGFPFSTYGESGLIGVQNIAISILILGLNKNNIGAATFVAGLGAGLYALFSPNGVSLAMLQNLMACAGALGIASKLPQILTIYQQGGTGQLSAFAVFNFLLGSLSRIFTTIQELDDKLVLATTVAGFALNAVLAAQMAYYWNSPTTAPHAKEISQKAKAIAHAEANDGHPVAMSSGARPKTPTTRRRA